MRRMRRTLTTSGEQRYHGGDTMKRLRRIPADPRESHIINQFVEFAMVFACNIVDDDVVTGTIMRNLLRSQEFVWKNKYYRIVIHVRSVLLL